MTPGGSTDTQRAQTSDARPGVLTDGQRGAITAEANRLYELLAGALVPEDATPVERELILLGLAEELGEQLRVLFDRRTNTAACMARREGASWSQLNAAGGHERGWAENRWRRAELRGRRLVSRRDDGSLFVGFLPAVDPPPVVGTDDGAAAAQPNAPAGASAAVALAGVAAVDA